jgi:hypothetical protein
MEKNLNINRNCFLFHDWGKWIQYDQPMIDSRTGLTFDNVRQKRVCQRCNKMQDELIF